MPSQITSLRLLLNHPPSFLSPLSPHAPLSPLVSRFSKGTRPQPFLLLRPISVLTVNSSSYRSGGRPRNIQFSPKFTFESKGNSSLSVDTKKQPIEKENPDSYMAGPEAPDFNKRRAEGRDKNDKPKTLEKKIRKLNPVNTICYAQILGTGMDTQDTSSSVLLFFDKQRFIFNAGEGLQRFCTEHKIKLSKIDHIFLSRVCSETAGGLPGLLLTLASIGDVGMSVNIWGPSDLQLMIDAMKSFIPNAAMVHTRSFGPLNKREQGLLTSAQNFSEPIVLVDDEVVKLSAILLRASYTVSGGGNSFPESFGSDGNNMASLKPGDLSVVYICELPEIKGKFDPQKAKALGLRAGPKYRELQLGNPVKSDTQDIMVHPNDVMDPSIPGPIVLLVDCPTESHLRYLSSVSSLNSYYAGFSSETGKKVNCVIHLSPSSVMNNPDYQLWMRKFGSTQHIMAGHEAENAKIPILKSSAKVAARLNYLCPKFFPASGFLPVEYINGSAQSCNTSSEEHQIIAAENLLKFHLRPYAQLGLDTSCIPVSNPHREIINQLLQEIPEVEIAADQVRKLWCDTVDSKENVIASLDTNNTMIEEPCLNENGVPNCLENISREDLEIVLLGTGSSQPSKYRNVSSIYINLFSKGSLLLDCGEGTLGQLKRRYGLEGADDAIRSLRCIWISHIHGDHHTGLARILALRRELLKNTLHEPLLVVGPRQLKRFLDAYQRLENLDMQFLDCKHTTQASLDAVMMSEFSTIQSSTSRSPDSTQMNLDESVFAKGSNVQSIFKRPGSPADHSVALPILQKLMKVLKEAGLGSLISFPVVHCPQAFGVALKASDRVNSVGKIIPGWKIVYSGDTRPCPELIKASRGATILIHEATFEDGMVDEAVARNHSTTSEAIEVGESAGAYRIILTHFSQRYPKIPVFDGTHMHNTCIGFDLMSINIADLHVLPQVLPYLKLLFRDEMLIEEESVDDLAEEAVRAAL